MQHPSGRYPRILITGANGQLGVCFRQLAALQPGWEFEFAAASDLDIGNSKAIRQYFNARRPFHWVINCAAYTAVDKAESDAVNARRVNATGPGQLAAIAASTGARLIHFSTDYVFHGKQNLPYKENDPVSPKGVYARTKLLGERAVLRAHPAGAMVIRTSWVYAPHGHNFVKTMLRLASERSELRVVADQIGSPTYAPDLAMAVLQIIDRVEKGQTPAEQIAGLWHYSNEGVASWYDFAVAIFDIKQLPCRVLPIETRDYPTPALRPPFSVLNKSRIKAAFHLEIPHWRSSLQTCLSLL